MRDLQIIANDLIKVYGSSDALNIRLKDGNNILYDYPVRITINGVTYNKIIENNGYATLNINLAPGDYPTTISFTGNDTYNPQTKEILVRVLNNTDSTSSTKNPRNYFEVDGIQLMVIMSNGFTVTPGIDIKETDMLKQTSSGNAPVFYFNQGNHGVEFEISVIMKESYRYDDYTVMDYIDSRHKYLVPVTVVTDALDVPNNKYILQVKNKTQKNHEYSIWKLKFREYYEDSLSFEKFYTEKTVTLSADDLELLKWEKIDENSWTRTIYALQRKLNKFGSYKMFDDVTSKLRRPTGVWDDHMRMDIFMFQAIFMNDQTKQGFCDRDTINALVNEDNYDYKSGWYDSLDVLKYRQYW